MYPMALVQALLRALVIGESVQQKAKSVVGIELVKEAIDDAKHNAQLNSKRQRLVRNRLFYM